VAAPNTAIAPSGDATAGALPRSARKPAVDRAASDRRRAGPSPLTLDRVLPSSQEAEIAVLASRYPHGHEQLVCAALGLSPADGGESATVLNVATLHAIFEAVVLDKPLIERVLTVTGSLVARPLNLKARVGTPIRDLFEECGGLVESFDVVEGAVVFGEGIDAEGLAVDFLFVVEDRAVGVQLPEEAPVLAVEKIFEALGSPAEELISGRDQSRLDLFMDKK
jgi:hypothetical protein